MKYIFSIILLFTLQSVIAQRDTGRVDLDKLKRQIDSSTKMMDSVNNALMKQMQDRELERTLKQNERNLDMFMAAQRERERQQKKQMWIRIGIGVLFAIILIVGLRRRARLKNKT